MRQIGTYGSVGQIRLGSLAIPFTACIVGVTNAMNLIDGLNGLAGGISFIASLFMAVVAYLSGNHLLAGSGLCRRGRSLPALQHAHQGARLHG